MKNVIAIAVHPDDETIACGGTLLKHKKNGDKVYWVIVTSVSEEYGFTKEIVEKRKKEIDLVADKYQFDQVIQLNMPTTRVDEFTYGELTGKFSVIFSKIKPHIIYLPFKGDAHTDHQIVFTATYSCTKSFRYPSIEKILMMETISETDFAPALNENAFIPNYYVNISEYLSTKIDILKNFGSELGNHPFPRSIKNIEALATLRGSQCGFSYAESFMLLKQIIA